MAKAKWVKQLTRENTLLDRSLRTIAYHQSLRELGKASISQSPIVGFGRVTSLYYSPIDYRKQQKVILKEFSGSNVQKMGEAITKFLEEGSAWADKTKNIKLNKKTFLKYFQEFNYHHAHSRGAVVYGYWGEPPITAKLRRALGGKLKGAELDHALSMLSLPKVINGSLEKLLHPSEKLEKAKLLLVEKLKLSAPERDLVEILSWFTFFYEIGERLSGLYYDQFLEHLGRIAGKREMGKLFWYGPADILNSLKGNKLSAEEIRRRKECFILRIKNNRLEILSGLKAKALYEKEFAEEVKTDADHFSGTIACLGKVIGEVKVVITEADQEKMRAGDILVSTMTTPRLMAAVKKAAAIVTDEGGLTAHAAIVAREFNIPCIIGTKIATQVLKDGDMVEVDATSGLVRKIN